MFQAYRNGWQALTARAQDVLSDVLGDPFGEPDPPCAPHPHRRPLHSRRVRRAGSVPHPPASCLCPVRRVGDRPDRGAAMR